MKPGKLGALFVIVAVLAATAVFKKATERQPAAEAPLAEERTVNTGLSSAFVSRIEIRQASTVTVVLTKKASSEWVIENRYGAPARKETVEALIKAFSDLRGEVRSDASELLADFKIDDAQGIRVRFDTTAGASQIVFLSPLRPSAAENFVRAGESREVLVVRKDLLGVLGLWSKDAKVDYKSFIDLRVVGFDPSKASRLELALDGHVEASLVRRTPEAPGPADEWRLHPSGEPADAMKVKALLNELSNLFGTDALDPGVDHGFSEAPSVRIGEKTETGEKERTLFFGKTDTSAKLTAVAVRPDGAVFAVAEDRLAPFRKKQTDFTIKVKA